MNDIIVGVERTDTAQTAAHTAAVLAASCGVHLHVITCIRPDATCEPRTNRHPRNTDAVSDSETFLRQLKESLPHDQITSIVGLDDSATTMCDEANRLDARIIVVSNRRVQGAGRVLAEVGGMTNQLTYTDADITTLLVPASLPLATSPAVNGEEPNQPTGSGRRWMLLAGGIALAATAVVGVAAAGNGSSDTVEPSTDQRSASAIIQDEIDAALAERDTAGGVNVQQPGYLIIQDEIDAALAERNVSIDEQRPTAQIVQDEIDAALAERDKTSVD